MVQGLQIWVIRLCLFPVVVNGRSMMSTPTIWSGCFTGMRCIGKEWSFGGQWQVHDVSTLTIWSGLFTGMRCIGKEWSFGGQWQVHDVSTLTIWSGRFTGMRCIGKEWSFGGQWEVHDVYSRPVDLCPPPCVLAWQIWHFKCLVLCPC